MKAIWYRRRKDTGILRRIVDKKEYQTIKMTENETWFLVIRTGTEIDEVMCAHDQMFA